MSADREGGGTMDSSLDNLATAVRLSDMQVEQPFSPTKVMTVLRVNEIRFVLIGTFGLAEWVKRPRASQDVEVLTSARRANVAAERLAAAFRGTRIVEGKEFITVDRPKAKYVPEIRIHSSAGRLHEIVLRHSVFVTWRKQTFRIPTAELAIARTFFTMETRPWTDADKYMDAHDFLRMIRKNPEFDIDRTRELVEAHDAKLGKKFLKRVRDFRAGKRFVL